VMEGAPQHLIGKAVGAFVGSDLGGEVLPHAEVDRFPGDDIAQVHHPCGHSRDRALLGVGYRVLMEIHAEREIETALDRCLDGGLQINGGHRPSIARSSQGRRGREGAGAIAIELAGEAEAGLDITARAERRAVLLDMALSVLASAGVVHLRVQREADVSNLGDLEELAAAKGGIRQLLDEKWRKVYRANAARGLFTMDKMRAS
jgi:hypothetical protein